MEKNKEANRVQGIEVAKETANETARKRGAMSILQSWKSLTKNLKGSGLVNEEDEKKITELYGKAVRQYIGEDLL